MSVLKPIRINEVIEEAAKELKASQEAANFMPTRWPKVNELLGGGIRLAFNICISGLSGSGKSTILNIIKEDIVVRNKIPKLINFWNFEAEGFLDIYKMLSRHEHTPVKEYLSGNVDIDKSMMIAEEWRKWPINYFNEPAKVIDIYETTKQQVISNPGYNVINIYDHSGLVQLAKEQDSLQMTDSLAKAGIALRNGHKVTNIWLSQLNGKIETLDRVTSQMFHAPTRDDMFGGKSLFNACDVVIINHCPANLGIQHYTSAKHPTKYFSEHLKGMNRVFWHFIKNRYGETGILPMTADFANNEITEEATGLFTN